jgi:hypothetical protein
VPARGGYGQMMAVRLPIDISEQSSGPRHQVGLGSDRIYSHACEIRDLYMDAPYNIQGRPGTNLSISCRRQLAVEL